MDRDNDSMKRNSQKSNKANDGQPSDDNPKKIVFASKPYVQSSTNNEVSGNSHVNPTSYKEKYYNGSVNLDYTKNNCFKFCHTSSPQAFDTRPSLNFGNANDKDYNYFESDFKNKEKQSCQKYKPCHEKPCSSSLDLNVPSTSGLNKVSDNIDFDNFYPNRESRKRPSSLKLNKPNLEIDDSSSDTGNDDYSLGSEDGCIYTYRGGEHLADLPSSFFSLDMGLPLDRHLQLLPHHDVRHDAVPNNKERVSRASSPDMDFLEMDFDPGPSCEADSVGELSIDEDLVEGSHENLEVDEVPVARGTTPESNLPASKDHNMCQKQDDEIQHREFQENSGNEIRPHEEPSTSFIRDNEATVSQECGVNYGAFITHINARGEQLLVRRTTSQWLPCSPINRHISSGDLVSPRELMDSEKPECEIVWNTSGAHQINQNEKQIFDNVNLSSALYHLTMAKKLLLEKPNAEYNEGSDNTNMAYETRVITDAEEVENVVEVGRCMVWSEREACERQVTQIATSACGATAVVNVFHALGIPVDADKINNAVGTRQRANTAPLSRYLLSRAVAGCTAADLVSGMYRASNGIVTARFFPMYPERAFSLSHWLADWISLGAVPIATLNLQVSCDGDIPDAWHHQMIFGVSSRGIYMCNPVECVREEALWPQLTSPSTLLVRSRDVLTRFTPRTDLTPLMMVPDHRFHTHNVLGQVVNLIREWHAAGGSESLIRTHHIKIPAAYQAGITLVTLTGSEAHKRLMRAHQLPVLSHHVPKT